MPQVNVVGEITFVVSDLTAASITWAITCGNNAWTLREGLNYGETQIAEFDQNTSCATLSHPIDAHFQTSAHEGWPLFIYEVKNTDFFSS